MSTMKAIGFYEPLPTTEDESLLDLIMEQPTPSASDLLIEVKAVAVNPIDTKLRMRAKQQETPQVLGFDVAGVVIQTGSAVTRFQPGDAVFYAGNVQRPGGNSQFHLVDERIVGKKPTSLSFAEAAALPLTSITAWEGLFTRMRIPVQPEQNQGRSILIIGAAGGVGSITIQLAKWAGLTVIGTASRPESKQWVIQQGADHVISHAEPLAPQLASLGSPQVDLIFCLQETSEYWAIMAEIIAPQGTICSIVDSSNPLNLNLLKQKSVTFVWEFMFTRPLFQTADQSQQHELLQQVSKLVDLGVLQTTLQQTLHGIHAKNLRHAHAQVESGQTIGKIVLTGGFGE